MWIFPTGIMSGSGNFFTKCSDPSRKVPALLPKAESF